MAELGDEAMALLRPDIPPREYVRCCRPKSSTRTPCVFWRTRCPSAKPSGGVGSARGGPPAPTLRRRSRRRSKPPKSGSRSRRKRTAARPCSGQGGRSRNLGRLRGHGRIFQRRQPRTGACARRTARRDLTAKAVSGAVIFAAVATEPENAPDRFHNFLAQGVEVTVKIKLWEPK